MEAFHLMASHNDKPINKHTVVSAICVTPVSSFDSALGLRPLSAIKTASGITHIADTTVC